MLSRVVRDLQHVEGYPVDTGLAQGVESGDVRTLVMDMLEDSCQLGVIVVLELNLIIRISLIINLFCKG